jgi:hypothetical protein
MEICIEAIRFDGSSTVLTEHIGCWKLLALGEDK